MGFNPGAPPPVPKAPKPKSHRQTPKQAALRSVRIAQEKEKLTHAKADRQQAQNREEFNRRWREYDDIYQAYHGGHIPKDYAAKLINRGISFTSFSKYLTKQPTFYKSDIWKQNSDKFLGPARNMGMKIPKQFVAQAIGNNWDPYVFQEKLRTLPKFREAYLASNEYKTTQAGLVNTFRQLYGDPSQEWHQEIQRAALGRWTPDQWLTKLRSLPEYAQSSEYQQKAGKLRQTLGFL